MPLFHSKSKKAFEHNVKEEMHEGKSQPQSLAIAYSVKRRAKKMAEGGQVTHENYQSSCTEHCNSPCEIHEQASGYQDHKGNDVKHNEAASMESGRKLNQHGADEEGPQGARMAEGGQVTDNYQDKHPDMSNDLVARVMKQRMYSKGGMVANDTPISAGFEENDFDYLAKHDDLESSYDGANSGDELGNEGEDERRRDVVMRAMLARRKQRNPVPA